MSEIHFSLPAETLFHIGPVEVTNGVTAAVASSLVLVLFAIWVRKGAGVVPTKRQLIFELVYEMVYEKLVGNLGSEKQVKRYLPLMMTVFLAIAVANQFAVLPFWQSIFLDHTMLFRVPSSDYSYTLAMMVIVVVFAANGGALLTSPLGYFSHFFKFPGLVNSFKNSGQKGVKGVLGEFAYALIQFGVGLLEVIGEFAKAISIATRLFGNIFAGEVLVVIIASLSPFTEFVATWPFLLLGLFVGFIQAFLFMILGVIYISLSLNSVQHSHSNGH